MFSGDIRKGIININYKDYFFDLNIKENSTNFLRPKDPYEIKLIDLEYEVRSELTKYISNQLNVIKGIDVQFENPSRGFFWIDFGGVSFYMGFL